MELALITPVAHLDKTNLLPGRFCVAGVALQSDIYKDYFATAARDKRYKVILDNGTFEEDVLAWDELWSLVQYIRPKVLIIPDILCGDWQANFAQAETFIDFVKKQNKRDYHPELMFVPQCAADDEEGFWKAISKCWSTEAIKWIGICRDACANAFSRHTQTLDQELNRFYFTVELQRRNYIRPSKCNTIDRISWHYLGIGDRIELIKYYWFVSSMDTASLFWQATMERIILGGQLQTEVARPRDYFERSFVTGPWLDCLEQNCILAQKYAEKARRLKRRLIGGRL